MNKWFPIIVLTWLFPVLVNAIMRPERSCHNSLSSAPKEATFYSDKESKISKALNREPRSWDQLPGFNYKEFDASRMVLVDEIYPPENFEGLLDIREELVLLEQEMSQAPSQQVVVYPLSSSDLSAPLVLFPNSKTTILIDSASAVEEGDWNSILMGSSEVEYNLSDTNRAWLDASPKTSSKSFQKLMTSLKFHKPHSSVKRITFFYENIKEVNLRIELQDNKTQNIQVIFYLSLNIRTLSKAIEQELSHWSLDILNSEKPNVLMAKASMGELGVMTRSEFARDYFLNRVFEQKGLIAEGLDIAVLHGETPFFEVTGLDFSVINKIRKQKVLQGVQYGYDEKKLINGSLKSLGGKIQFTIY